MNLFSLPKLSPRAELLAKTLHHLTPLVDHSTTFSRQIFQQDAMIQPYFDHPFIHVPVMDLTFLIFLRHYSI